MRGWRKSANIAKGWKGTKLWVAFFHWVVLRVFLQEVANLLKEVVADNVAFENKLEDVLGKEFEDLLTSVEQKTQKAKSSQFLESVLHEVSFVSGKMDKFSENLGEEHSESLEIKENKIKQSNHEFRKTIRLFSEDGNFSQDEAKRYFKEMKKLETMFTKKIMALKKDYNTKHVKIKTATDNKMGELRISLQRLKEEFQFREVVIKEIRDVQSKIKTGVYDKKLTIKRYSAEIRRLAHSNFSNVNNLEHFITDFEDLAKNISEFLSYLSTKENGTFKTCD